MTRSISRSSNAEQLEEVAVWRRSQRTCAASDYPEVREPELHKLIIRDIIDVEVCDVITSQRGSDRGGRRAERGRRAAAGRPLIRYSASSGREPRSCGVFSTRTSTTIRAWRK